MILALAEVETVTAVTNKQEAYLVKVRCQQQTSCNSCQSQKSCGTGIVSKAFGNKTHTWQLTTTEPIAVGDLVEIGLPDKSLVLSSLMIYLFPLIVMILATFAANAWLAPLLGGGEGIVIASFILSGIASFFAIKPILAHLEAKVVTQVSLIRVLGKAIL